VIIGLTGASGSRKTSVAKHLKRQHGYARMHAGKPVKKAAQAFGVTDYHTDADGRDNPTALLGGARPRDLMEAIGNAVSEATPHAIPAMLQRRVAAKLATGRSLVVDGIRTAQQADVVRRLGGMIVRTDNGKPVDPTKPMDRRASAIKVDYTIDTSGKKSERKAAVDKMLQDIRS
jgi:hypothetical protein